MDIIFIKGLKIDTIIGIFDWERQVKQDIILDIEIYHNIKKATDSDNIKYAVDYKEISNRLVDFVQNSSFFLIETLAEKVASIILNEFNIKKVKVTIDKGNAIRKAVSVGVSIEREKKFAQVHINIGSNINKEKNIKKAIELLQKEFTNIKLSFLYQSKSFGFNGDDFYNIGANFTTSLSAKKLIDKLHEIEFRIGRKERGKKFISKIIDIDINIYDNLIDKNLNIPRNDLLNHDFVLAPMNDINPDKTHPKNGIKFSEIWKNFYKKDRMLKRLDISMLK